MTQTRQIQLEQLLRKLRKRCFESEKAARLIPIVKDRLMPIWQEQSNYRHQYHWMYAAE